MKKLLIIGVLLPLLAASCNQVAVKSEPTVSGSVIEAPVQPAEPATQQPPTETKSTPKSNKVSVKDVLDIPTPEELAAKVDQNTIN